MEIPPTLVERIAEGDGVLLVGAGLSQGAGLPGWPVLLRSMLDTVEEVNGPQDDRGDLEAAIDANDLLTVAEELRERLGLDEFRRFMREQIHRRDAKPTPIHSLIHRIPFAAMVTTNYDRLIEGGYAKEHDGSLPHAFTHADVPELGAALREGFYLLKAHGDIDRIETVILGTEDYRRIIHESPGYRRHLATLFATKTVLFVGFSLNDPDLQMILDELRAEFREYAGRHYTLMPEGEVSRFQRNRFEKDNGIRVIPFKPPQDIPKWGNSWSCCGKRSPGFDRDAYRQPRRRQWSGWRKRSGDGWRR